MNRVSGFYWCRMGDIWEVSFYNVDELAFERTMDDSYTYDDEFDEIDERKIKR